MLPAAKTTPRLRASRGYRLVTLLTAILLTYTLAIGVGLAEGMIRYESAYLLIALPCFVPVVAYIYGFLQVTDSEQDWGLLFSAIGWACVALALFIQHSALQSELRTLSGLAYGMPQDSLENSAFLCLILAIAFIVGGAALSLHAWNRERSAMERAENERTLREAARRTGG